MSKYTEELKKQIVLEHKIKHYGASSTTKEVWYSP